MPVSLADKKKNLEAIIGREKRAGVACSGGVDSTLLLRIAHDVLGHDNAIAIFAETPLLPPGETEAAADVINHIGCRILTVSLNPLAWPEFTGNPRHRCYLCKKKIYQAFQKKLAESDFATLMDGTNRDDLDDYRPGLKALRELSVKTPLAEAGLTKSEVRELSRNLGLPNWNKYSSSCLATRISTGELITCEKLDLVKKCENFLEGLDFFGCRVRIAGDSAVIELLEKDLSRLMVRETRALVLRKFNDFNMKTVSLSLRGRPGL